MLLCMHNETTCKNLQLFFAGKKCFKDNYSGRGAKIRDYLSDM